MKCTQRIIKKSQAKKLTGEEYRLRDSFLSYEIPSYDLKTLREDAQLAEMKFLQQEQWFVCVFTLLSDTERKVIEAYDVWKEKKNYGKVSMGVVRTTYLIDENGIIIKANDKVKAADDPEKMLQELS